MTGETAREVSTNPEVLKRLAKYLAQQCFRNTMLEDLHAGTTPDSQIGDYTDVVLRSPCGQIPWPNLSRILWMSIGKQHETARCDAGPQGIAIGRHDLGGTK
jgi:hypothetical protein